MRRFETLPTPIEGLQLIQRQPVGDGRGYLERIFCSNDLKSVTGDRVIAQVNFTVTRKEGVVRGMHFQHHPYSEMKLISCLHGEIFDVAVDLRKGSPTFLKWHAEVLSERNHRTLCIPEGFAHGYQTLTDGCELLYFHTVAYEPDAEGGLNALDPIFGIDWPLPVSERSERDKAHAMLAPNFSGLVL